MSRFSNRAAKALALAAAALTVYLAPAGVAFAGWFVEGREFSGSAALSTTATLDRPIILSSAGLTIECKGRMEASGPEIKAVNTFTASSIIFTGCRATSPVECGVPTTLGTVPTTGELVGATFPADKILFKPSTGKVFVTISVTGLECAQAGNKPITGDFGALLPTGQEEQVLQALDPSQGSTGLLKLGNEWASLEGQALLKLTSGHRWGGSGPPPSPPHYETVVPNPGAPGIPVCDMGKSVDCATGNETEQQTDISIGGRGPGLRVVRSYNALSAAEAKASGPWGYGWTGPYDATLEAGTETVIIHQDNGSAVTFYKAGAEYIEGGWIQAHLAKVGTSYVYTLPDQSKLEFNSEGKLVKETDQDGNSNVLTYKEGRLEKVEDGDKRTLAFKYNGEGLVSSVEDPMKHVVSYTYASKQLSTVTIEGKERWKFEYESPNLLTKVTDGRGHSTTIKYETGTHKVTEEEIAGHKRKWEYKGSETLVTEPNGSETLDVFNSAGEPTKEVRAKGKGEETVTEWEYSAETYNRTKLIDPNKHATEYGYDAEGNKTSEKDPEGDETKWEYSKERNVIKETSPEGEVTTIERNSKGEPTKVERPIGSETQVTEYKYATNGDLEEETDPLKHKTKYTYDGAGDRETATDPEGNEHKWKYNADSQVTEATSPRKFTTVTTRDERGLPTKIEDPLKHTTEYAYDGNGNVESETDGNGHTTKYEYNEENLRTKVEEPNKTVVETGYDAEGQMTSHTDGNKHTWEYKRNALEQVTEEKNPLGKIWEKTYEKAGNLQKLEDPEKHTTEYTYDKANRLEKVKYSTGEPSEVTYKYNKDNKVTEMKDETGTTENTWDKLDRLTKYKNGAGKVVEYEYDLANLPTKITYPNGKAVTREYDKDDRLEKITDWNAKTTAFKYTADSQLEKTNFPAGTEGEDSYAYNEADQMTEIHFKHGASTLASLVYTRDGDGQVKKTTATGLPGSATSESVYDENNRLTEAQGKAYEYDKANNATKIEGSAVSYNEADELKEGLGFTFGYNEDAQRTEAKETGGVTTTYGYDQAGNLTSVKRPSGPEVNDSFTYDGNNLREGQTVNGTKENLTWDTTEALPVLLEDETSSYIYGPEGLPIEQISSGGETLYLHRDQQGSTRLLTNATGETVATFTYDAFGKLNASTGTAGTRLRYDGQYTTSNAELIYLRARTYDPDFAEFLTPDPVLQTTGEPYAYTDDNPENHTDLGGLCGNPHAKKCDELAREILAAKVEADANMETVNSLRKQANDLAWGIVNLFWRKLFLFELEKIEAEIKKLRDLADRLEVKANNAGWRAKGEQQLLGCF